MENRKKYYETKKKLLLEHLVKRQYLTDKRLIKAFIEIPLEAFIPEKYTDPSKIYEDMPNLFYYEKPENYRTISAPHMISIMLQGLSLKENDDLLILGAKSGYIAALAHRLAPKGEIVILEANSEIAKITDANLNNLNLHDNISVIVKNPLEGSQELSPWQKILVTGAIEQDRIYSLLKQLDPNDGVLYAPIGEDFVQIYTQVLRIDNDFFGKKQLQVRFTPLMTQVELDDLELITNFDDLEEIEIREDPAKVDDTLSKFKERLTIKYTSSIFDDMNLEPVYFEPINIDTKQQEIVINCLTSIKDILKKLKKEDNISQCFDFVDDIELQIETLKQYKKNFDIKTIKFQNYLNQIRTHNIIRKELMKKESSETTFIDREIEIINRQIEDINKLNELLNSEIKRIEEL